MSAGIFYVREELQDMLRPSLLGSWNVRSGERARRCSHQLNTIAAALACFVADAEVAPSPVVELNRAVAVGRAFGPEAALALVDGLAADPALARYQWLPSVRGDLLEQLGRDAEARAAFEAAAGMARNAREREFLLERARRLGASD
mgnify:CR=1 FL=1